MAEHHGRRKRAIVHRLFVLLLTPILIATNLLGAAPANRISTELRRYMAWMFPPAFTGWLNPQLTGVSLPTLPSRSGTEVDLPPLATAAVIVMPPTSTAAPTFISTPTLTPTFTLTPTRTTTPTVSPTPTLVPNPAGVWLFSWQHSTQYNTVWQDSFKIVQRGDRFLVTFVSDPYLGSLDILSQSWDGSSLDFTYQNWAIPVTVHLKTIGVDSEGKLWVSVLSQWMGPPVTSLPPVP